MISIRVNDKPIDAAEGANLLQVCLDNEVFIPNLCYLEGMGEPPASCRMCFVEIEGEASPVAACTVRITAPLVISTDTERVRRLQRTNLKLLLSVHHVDCRNCPANKQCELQRLAKFLKLALNSNPLKNMLGRLEIDSTHPCLDYHPYRCVLCGRCVAVCHDRNGQPVLSFAKRGFDTIISSFGMHSGIDIPCEACSLCQEICPVGALTLKSADQG